MCLSAKKGLALKNTHLIKIEDALIGEQYICKDCGGLLGVKNPTDKVKHFFHIESKSSFESENESELHYDCKMSILQELQKKFPDGNWQEERYIKQIRARPDISGRINGKPIVVEVQHSPLTPAEIKRRTSKYDSMGIYTIWVVPYYRIHTGLKSPKLYEKFLHALYKGNLYVWSFEGLFSLHFYYHSKSKRYVIKKEISWEDMFIDYTYNNFSYKGVECPNLKILSAFKSKWWPKKAKSNYLSYILLFLMILSVFFIYR